MASFYSLSSSADHINVPLFIRSNLKNNARRSSSHTFTSFKLEHTLLPRLASSASTASGRRVRRTPDGTQRHRRASGPPGLCGVNGHQLRVAGEDEPLSAETDGSHVRGLTRRGDPGAASRTKCVTRRRHGTHAPLGKERNVHKSSCCAFGR